MAIRNPVKRMLRSRGITYVTGRPVPPYVGTRGRSGTSDVRFAAVHLPEANDLTVGIMALVAQQEREAISRRTKDALAMARSLGVRLSNPNGAEALRRARRGAVALRAAVVASADLHAHDLASVVADIQAGGATGLRAMAAELNARGMLIRRGGRWHVSNVANLLGRLGLREDRCASPG